MNGWDQATKKNYKKRNLTREEHQALIQLSIITEKADKGGGTVIMNREDYIKETEDQLKDEKVYKRLTQDPTKEIKREIDVILQEALEQGDIKRALDNDYLSVPTLYLVLKIHKDINMRI